MKTHSSAPRLKPPLLVAVVASGVGVAWYLDRAAGGPLTQGYQLETAALSRGELTQAVTARAQLNPVLKGEVGSHISGIIENLFADFNSSVKAGQLIAQIDPGTYEANFIQAEGNLANAKAGLELAQVNTRRNQELFKNNLI